MPDKTPKGGGLPIADIIEGVGKIGVNIVDTSKRRQMEFATNQQQLQAQLGLAEKTAQQQYELARLNVLAQAASGKTSGAKEPKPWQKALILLPFLFVGAVAYFVTKDR